MERHPSDTVEFPRIEADELTAILPVTTARPTPDDSHTRQARRETRWHRVRVTVLAALGVALLYTIQVLIWPHAVQPSGAWQEAWSWSSLLWAVTIIPALCELTGLYLWQAPAARERVIDHLVCWRVVSRGINTEALCETIAAHRREMAATPLFPYVIEVVVDSNEHLAGLPPEADDLFYLVVPREYTTPLGSKNKARALNYALHHSPLGEHQWIVHMDEESHPTRSVVIGIAAMIDEEENRHPGVPRVGQGTITYHRDWKNHPFFTLSDCIRSGSDLGRLYLSMKIGVPVFGLHGSFIVIRNDVEKAVGFDVGPRGSLTEDAWWGTLAMDQGIRCRWVEGHVAEQCTQKVTDFLKQRRRWFNGLARTSVSAPSSFRWRVGMFLSMIVWGSAPIAWVYTVAHLLDGGAVNPVIRVMANLSLAVYVTTTLVGLRLNLREHGETSRFRKIGWALTWLACLPAFSLLEATAVAYAIIRPARDFHVVKK